MPKATDRDLLQRAAAGDRDAFAAFYRAHVDLVLAFMLVRTGDPHTAADLASETFARALDACRSRRAVEVPARWLFGIARNLLADSYRARRVESRARERLDLPRLTIGEDDLDRIVELVDLLRGGTRALDRLDVLPERQREAVRARILDEAAYGDIARRLDCSAVVVRQLVRRGLVALRAGLEGDETR
jgi:RNA polymerase sigma factor (sigma-70 family)